MDKTLFNLDSSPSTHKFIIETKNMVKTTKDFVQKSKAMQCNAIDINFQITCIRMMKKVSYIFYLSAFK